MTLQNKGWWTESVKYIKGKDTPHPMGSIRWGFCLLFLLIYSLPYVLYSQFGLDLITIIFLVEMGLMFVFLILLVYVP